MKKIFTMIMITLMISSTLLADQSTQHTSFRVYQNNQFISTLSLNDLQMSGSGENLKIDSLYYIKGNQIVRQEGKHTFNQPLSRHFILIFLVKKYDAKLDNAINYFFKEVILPGDSVAIFTPAKNYNLKSIALKNKPKDKIAEQLRSLLRRDTMQGNNKYLSMLKTLTDMVKSLNDGSDNFSLEVQLPRFHDTLRGLESLRINRQKNMIQFIQAQKKVMSQKFVYLFYDREFTPTFSVNAIQAFKHVYKDRQDILQFISSLFEFYTRDVFFKLEELGQELAGAAINVNAIYFKGKFIGSTNVPMSEHSEDIFKIFQHLCDSTGGVSLTSSNLLGSLKKLVRQSDTYYMIGFKPADKKEQGSFNPIRIKTGNDQHKIIQNSGY